MVKVDYEKSINISDFIEILQGLVEKDKDLRCIVKAVSPFTNVERIMPLTGIAIQKVFVDCADAYNELAIIFNTEEA